MKIVDIHILQTIASILQMDKLTNVYIQTKLPFKEVNQTKSTY